MRQWFRTNRQTDTRSAGEQAEAAAETWLAERGLRTLARNWRCKGGELDRVMLDGEVLVFVEVRWRARADFGGAAASITASKQRRLTHAAQFFLMLHPQHQKRACRFDAMLAGADGQWSWLRDAF